MTSGTLTSPGIKAPGDYIEDVMISVKAKNSAEPEFHQAVQEVLESTWDLTEGVRAARERRPARFEAR